LIWKTCDTTTINIVSIAAGEYLDSHEFFSLVLTQAENKLFDYDIDKWRLAFLLCIDESNANEQKKIDKLQEVYSQFNYPKDMYYSINFFIGNIILYSWGLIWKTCDTTTWNKTPVSYTSLIDIIDNYAGEATRFDIPTKGPGGSIIRTSELRQIQGSNNGTEGIFEWIIDQGGVTHRRFIPGGRVTGLPNQIPGI
jgi:hypothetical protein